MKKRSKAYHSEELACGRQAERRGICFLRLSSRGRTFGSDFKVSDINGAL